MSYIALTLPGGQSINAPGGVPTGGIVVASKVVGNSVTILLIIAVILTIIFLIVGGIQWIQSGGDKQKVAAARARLTYAVIGLIVALLAIFIINIVGTIFNVKLF